MSERNAIDYTPPPTVGDFIQHYIPNELFYDWICGPIGSGKTTGMLFKLAYMASLQHPSPRDGVRRSRAVIVRNTAPQLSDTTIPSWNTWFKDGQAGQWKATIKNFVLKFADVECEVMFRPLDTPDDVARVLSLEVTFAIIDEFVQIDKAIIEALSGRCGRYPAKIDGGPTNWGMWGASNPGNEDSWWHSYLIANPLPANVRLFVQPNGLSPQAENVDNLPNKYYENQTLGKSQEWVNQFIKCQWGYSLLGKPVIPSFMPAIHVAPGPLTPNPHLPLVIGLDPGMGGSALILGQQDMHGRLLVYDELIQRDMGAERIISDRLRPLLRTPKYINFKPIIAPDPAGASRTQTDERSVVDIFRKHFDVKYDTNNTLEPRLSAIEHYTTRLTDVGPALLIDPACKTLVRAMGGGWCYDISTKGQVSPAPNKNNPYSHPGDALGYLAKYFQMETQRELKRSRHPVPMSRFDNTYNVR